MDKELKMKYAAFYITLLTIFSMGLVLFFVYHEIGNDPFGIAIKICYFVTVLINCGLAVHFILVISKAKRSNNENVDGESEITVNNN